MKYELPRWDRAKDGVQTYDLKVRVTFDMPVYLFVPETEVDSQNRIDEERLRSLCAASLYEALDLHLNRNKNGAVRMRALNTSPLSEDFLELAEKGADDVLEKYN